MIGWSKYGYFFKNNIEFKEDTILKVNFKYSLELSRKKVTKTDIEVDRYTMDLCFKVMGGNLTCNTDDLYNLFSEKIVRNYFSKIQISRIKWHVICITNITGKSFIARLPLRNCYGSINLPLSNISQDHYYVYHLYRNKITPFKFVVKRVLLSVDNVIDLTSNLDNLSNLFTRRIPVNEDVNKKSYLKYVKDSHKSGYSRYTSDFFEEIQVAFPWGFQPILRVRKRNKKRNYGR
ncbi:hypothetical protein [Bacillus paranthracis]|uniref:hypothetical protein n=1 Tax=Bacillus paranthracis TaxID=2026186 RepID=UPI003D65B67B